MQIKELELKCLEAIDRWKSFHRDLRQEYPSISLVVPQLATGNNVRLCGKSGPLSEFVANVQYGKGTVAYWDARKILKFLKKMEKTDAGSRKDRSLEKSST